MDEIKKKISDYMEEFYGASLERWIEADAKHPLVGIFGSDVTNTAYIASYIAGNDKYTVYEAIDQQSLTETPIMKQEI